MSCHGQCDVCLLRSWLWYDSGYDTHAFVVVPTSTWKCGGTRCKTVEATAVCSGEVCGCWGGGRMCRGAALAGRVLEEDHLVDAWASRNHPGFSNMRFLQCMKVATSSMTFVPQSFSLLGARIRGARRDGPVVCDQPLSGDGHGHDLIHRGAATPRSFQEHITMLVHSVHGCTVLQIEHTPRAWQDRTFCRLCR